MVTFVLAALVLIMIPGPDQALITRSALVGGRAGGLLTMLGGVLGLTVHATAAAFGLSALLLASTMAFMVLKIVGAVYLLWLGLMTLRSAYRSRKDETAVFTAQAPTRRLAYFRQGLLSNALNPKIALFFVTFLPQFLPADASAPWAQALLLSAVFAVLYLGWFSFYVLVIDRLARLLRRPRVKAGIEGVTGLILVGLALRLASAHQ
ncbi:LysE family translocator [Streptosporangium sp. CA-135522]|uniref:LysE family translocator n=1 Tax=Streptosporangium sp. CA-135522 TaxID=3240072 RepID=UPI003D90D435